jgi:hypothetical protein
MSIAFTIISVLGVVVFFAAGAWPVGIVFAGLTGVYICEFFASFAIGARTAPPSSSDSMPTDESRGDATSLGTSAALPFAYRAVAPVTSNPAERVLGLVRIATGLWLMYLTFATTLDISLHYHLPSG